MSIGSRSTATVVVTLIVLTGCGAEASGNVSAGPGGPGAVPVVAVDNRFEPERLDLPAGDEIEVEVTNEGGTTHDFTIEELDLSTGPIEPGEVATATLTVPGGEITFVCSLHGGMEGSVTGS
jgi:nitrite reductase (NO-forming)